MLGYLVNADEQEKKMVNNQIEKLKNSLKRVNDELLKNLEAINIKKPLSEIPKKEFEIKKPVPIKIKSSTAKEISELDKEILKRLKKKKEKKIKKKEKKPSSYIKIANNFFSEPVKSFLKKRKLVKLEKDLIKSNLGYTLRTYLSMLIFTTILAVIISFFIFR